MSKKTKKAKAEAKAEETKVEAIAPAETIEATEPTEAPAKEQVAPKSQKIRRAEVPADVSHNPSQIEWPTDIWGLTKDLKKAFLAAASRVSGQADKKELVDAVLKIAHRHLEAKYSKDSAFRAARIEKAKAEEEANTEQPTLF
jgi:hypothetical protein